MRSSAVALEYHTFIHPYSQGRGCLTGITKVPITELLKIIYCGHPQVMVVTVFAIAVTVVILVLKLYITLGFRLGVLELYTGILTIALHQAIQYTYTVT